MARGRQKGHSQQQVGGSRHAQQQAQAHHSPNSSPNIASNSFIVSGGGERATTAQATASSLPQPSPQTQGRKRGVTTTAPAPSAPLSSPSISPKSESAAPKNSGGSLRRRRNSATDPNAANSGAANSTATANPSATVSTNYVNSETERKEDEVETEEASVLAARTAISNPPVSANAAPAERKASMWDFLVGIFQSPAAGAHPGIGWVLTCAMIGALLGAGIGTGHLTGGARASEWRTRLGRRIRSSTVYGVLTMKQPPSELLHLFYDPNRNIHMGRVLMSPHSYKLLWYERIYFTVRYYLQTPEQRRRSRYLPNSPYRHNVVTMTPLNPVVADEDRAFFVLRETLRRYPGAYIHPDLGILNPAPCGADRGLGFVSSSYSGCQTRCFPGNSTEKLEWRALYQKPSTPSDANSDTDAGEPQPHDGITQPPTTVEEKIPQKANVMERLFRQSASQNKNRRNHDEEDDGLTKEERRERKRKRDQEEKARQLKDYQNALKAELAKERTTIATIDRADEANKLDPPHNISRAAGAQRRRYAQEEVLLKIPLEAQMTRSKALQVLQPLLPFDVQRDLPLDDLDDAVLLALFLAHEQGRGRLSPYLPYIATLPKKPTCGYFPLSVTRKGQSPKRTTSTSRSELGKNEDDKDPDVVKVKTVIASLGIDLGVDVRGWPSEIKKAADFADRMVESLARDYGNYIIPEPPNATTYAEDWQTDGASEKKGEDPLTWTNLLSRTLGRSSATSSSSKTNSNHNSSKGKQSAIARESIAWALCQVVSRGTAGSERFGRLRLVPMLDMINHDLAAQEGFVEVKGTERMDKGDFIDATEDDAGDFVVRSTYHGLAKPLRKGQELMANYNVPSYTPLDWFVSLGFVPAERTLPWTRAEPALHSSNGPGIVQVGGGATEHISQAHAAGAAGVGGLGAGGRGGGDAFENVMDPRGGGTTFRRPGRHVNPQLHRDRL